MDVRGFDNRWADFPDYIFGITKEIWEERGVGARMKDYYHPEVVVRTPSGVSLGEPNMTAATLATLAEFPDRVLLGEDVIWSGDPEAGMLSSHRIVSQVPMKRAGAFGPAHDGPIVWRAMADCYAKDGQISDEWLVRDNGAVVRQMGVEPEDWVRAELDAGRDAPAFTPKIDVTGPYRASGNDHAVGARYADLLTRLMEAELSLIATEYDRACTLAYPGGRTGHGHAAADAFWLGLRSAFPSAEFTLHHVIGREDPMMPPRAAVRFALDGRHDGWGPFGRPTGAMVHVMGIAHAEFGPWGLRREWVVFDETAIWRQILTGT